jgi:SAM-dependent methyltransferase
MRPHKKPVNPEPSEFLAKFAEEIALGTNGPIADVACGYGRNAFLVSSFGVPVLCIDNDRKALDFIESLEPDQPEGSKLLSTLELDLINDPWPFGNESLGTILNVHFLTARLLDYFLSSLKIGGYIFIETIGGNGGNYLQLLPQGYIKRKLTDAFEVRFYREKKVGPTESDASTVKVFAIKRQHLKMM